MGSEVDVRHRAYEIAQHIADGSLTRLDYVDSTTLIHETGQCLKHLLGIVGDLEADGAGLEVEIERIQKEQVAHNADRNAELNRVRKRLASREGKIEKLEHAISLQGADIEQLREEVSGKNYAPSILLKESEKQLDEANDKIAEQAQEIVELRTRWLETLDSSKTKWIEAQNNDLSGLAEREAGQVWPEGEPQRVLTDNDARAYLATIDFMSKSQEKRTRAYLDLAHEVTQLRTECIRLISENARLAAADSYLKRSRRSYLTGAVSAVGDLVRMVRGKS